jgi:hypothetical protein
MSNAISVKLASTNKQTCFFLNIVSSNNFEWDYGPARETGSNLQVQVRDALQGAQNTTKFA